MSNDRFFKCTRKNTCSGNGQRSDRCPSGGITGNQQCRCDYQKGFISSLPFHDPAKNPDGKYCFNPIKKSGRCLPYKCDNGLELNRGVYMYDSTRSIGYIELLVSFSTVLNKFHCVNLTRLNKEFQFLKYALHTRKVVYHGKVVIAKCDTGVGKFHLSYHTIITFLSEIRRTESFSSLKAFI